MNKTIADFKVVDVIRKCGAVPIFSNTTPICDELKEKNDFTSILDEIDGIGPILKSKLLSVYKTIDNIKNADNNELKSLGLKEDTINALKSKLEEEIDFE